MEHRETIEAFAAKIPLATVTRLRDLEELMAVNGNLPLTSNPTTRAVEDRCGLPPSRYFYAGKAYWGYGDVALSYLPAIERKHSGSSNPFDTGEAYRQTFAPVKSDRARAIRLIRETLFSLSEWRKEFAGFLRAYFPRLRDYFSGTPSREGDWGHQDLPARYPNTDWRAWTWEVRLHEEHPLSQHLHLWATSEQNYLALTNSQITLEQPPLGAVAGHPLEALLQHHCLIDIDPCGRLTRELQNELLET